MTFSSMNPMLFSKVSVLAKIESTYNVDAVPVAASNSFLVDEVDVRVDPTVIERNNLRASISPTGITVGRKLQQVNFTHELKGSGSVGTAPAIGPLLRACGFAQTVIANTASATIVTPVVRTGASSPAQGATFAKTTAATQTGRYRLTCVKGGASATAKLRVTGIPATPDELVMPSETYSGTVEGSGTTMTLTQGLTSASDYTSITYTVAGTFHSGDILVAVVGGVTFKYTVVPGDTDNDGAATALAALIDADPRFVAAATTGVVTVTFPANSSTSKTSAVVTTSGTTAIPIGGSGAEITPTWTGSLSFGDSWDLQVLEPGVHYTPVSENFESLTIYVYLDGLLHKITGAEGTVSFQGEAGNYARASFQFTGQYVAPVDASLPTGAVYEQTLPQQVEVAQLSLNNKDDFCVQSFSLDMGVQVTPRDCINRSDGFNGVTITGRQPQGSINPEMTTVANFDFFALMAAGTMMPFHVRVGSTAGNIVKITSDSVQLSGIQYGERNRIRVADISMRPVAYSADGNDEVRLIFA